MLGHKMNQRRRHRFLPSILISTALNSVAQTPPPAAPFSVLNSKTTIKQVPSTGLQMGTLHVRFEKLPLTKFDALLLQAKSRTEATPVKAPTGFAIQIRT
jgi:hypothetical protein